jgi:hypothetical protein
VAGMQQPLTNVRADKAGATGDQEIHSARLAHRAKSCRVSGPSDRGGAVRQK